MNENEKYLYNEVLKNAMIRAFDARKCKASLEVLSSSIAHVLHILDMASGNTSSPALTEVTLQRVKGELDSLKRGADESAAVWEEYSDELILKVSEILKENE